MARHYVLGSWANADEFDYSGEQLMGSRHGKSVCMDHMLPNGMANLKRYGDPVEQKPASKSKKSVADLIDLAQRHYDRIEKMSIDLDSEYFAGEIDEERYHLLRYKMDERLAKAWKRLEKENTPIWNKLEAIEEINREAAKSLAKSMEKSLTEDSIFNSLSEDNLFRKLFMIYKEIRKILSK